MRTNPHKNKRDHVASSFLDNAENNVWNKWSIPTDCFLKKKQTKGIELLLSAIVTQPKSTILNQKFKNDLKKNSFIYKLKTF